MSSENKIDGIWIANGLRAEFSVIRKLENTVGMYEVETAAGDNFAHEEELHFLQDFDELVKWSGLHVDSDRKGYFHFENGVRIDIGKTRDAAAAYLRETMKPIK